ncbi:MAG: hypothetical protein ABI781_02915, partial [Burkholderiales bacterium]
LVKNIPIDHGADHAAIWSTASFGSAADTSPRELAALGEHLRRCAAERGSLFPLKSAAETLNRLAEPRLITIIVLFALLSVLASLVL